MVGSVPGAQHVTVLVSPAGRRYSLDHLQPQTAAAGASPARDTGADFPPSVQASRRDRKRGGVRKIGDRWTE